MLVRFIPFLLLRRPAQAISIALLLFAATVPATAEAAPRGFELGVAAGEVKPRSALLWGKAKRSGQVEVQLATRGRFSPCDVSGASRGRRASARAANDNTIRKVVTGLSPDTDYRYRFCMEGGKQSETGRFSTAPKRNADRKVRFAIGTGQDPRSAPGESEPYWPDWTTWDRIRKLDNDFNIMDGDTLYMDSEIPAYAEERGDVRITRRQKADLYRDALEIGSWARTRGSTGYYTTWDDHEFIEDFVRSESKFVVANPIFSPDDADTEWDPMFVDIPGTKLFQNGMDAYLDYNPGPKWNRKTGLYRHFRWGRNLEIFFLDERSFRSSNPEYDANSPCINPISGDMDVAPTMPTEHRQAFSALVPSLAAPVSADCLAEINDPDRTILGKAQLARFKRDIAASKATFKVVLTGTELQQWYGEPYDRWEGYAAEREELIRHLQGVDNVVWVARMTGMITDVSLRPLEANASDRVESGVLSVSLGPITGPRFADEIDTQVGRQGAAVLYHDAFLKPDPPSGLGMSCAAIDQNSHAQVSVSSRRLVIQLLDDKNEPVRDTGDIEGDPDAPACGRAVLKAR